MKTLRKVLHDWFTGPGSTHYEAGRALWFISVLCALAFSGWHLRLNGEFSITDFGLGMGGLLTLGGIGVAAKDMGAGRAKQDSGQ